MTSSACELSLTPQCSLNAWQPRRPRTIRVGRRVGVPWPAPLSSSTKSAPDPRGRRRCHSFDFYKQLVPYKDAWSLQKSLVAKRHVLVDKDEDHSDMLVILQHPPVYTLGTNSTNKYLKFNIEEAPFDVFRTERGGEVTYHGPGQATRS